MSNEKREALLAELDFHETEFTNLRGEILQRLDSQRQYLNLNLVAIAAALGIAPYILEQKAFMTLLLYPIIFHVLLWEMLASVRMIWKISNYIADKITPRVNFILDELGDNHREVTVLGWEIYASRRMLRKTEWVLASIAPTQHWVPILSIASFLIAYIVITRSYGYFPSVLELIIIFINLLFLIFAALRNALVARLAFRDTQKTIKKEELESVSEKKTESEKSYSS